jgi:hypothetical protein
MIGLDLERKANLLDGKQDAALRIKERRNQLEALMERSQQFWRFVWPIASLQVEHFEGVATNELELAEQMTR